MAVRRTIRTPKGTTARITTGKKLNFATIRAGAGKPKILSKALVGRQMKAITQRNASRSKFGGAIRGLGFRSGSSSPKKSAAGGSKG